MSSLFGSGRKSGGNETDIDYNRRMAEQNKIWNAAIDEVINNVEFYEWQLDRIRKLKK